MSNLNIMDSALTKKDLLRIDSGLNNRPYQLDALLSIFPLEKCLVKMFCGTGKSRIITNVMIHAKKELNVVVFPSLALISQYSSDYLQHVDYRQHFENTLNVSSLKEQKEAEEAAGAEGNEICSGMKITTTPSEIKHFLKTGGSKVILVTYQSYSVLLDCLDCLDGQKIGLVCYDEAHHVTSVETQKLVFQPTYFEKEVFFTATPRNANGITMFDRDEPENNMCGPVAYDYTYLNGLSDEVLNQFKLCVDMYTENTTASIYEAMARGILSNKTSRILTFHAGVNGESNTSVWNFVNRVAFQTALKKVQENEFPELAGYYTRVTFEGMDGNTPAAVRKRLLAALDGTAENEIYIISSCETIGEGVDTKRANMCVFADPKASVVKIIQNIGRIVRRNPAHPVSTVLIPCFIDMNHYAEAQGDRVKQDELIREQMRSDKGDYTGILNVLAALRQEDPEIYDMCLNYPNRRLKETSLAKQGFSIIDEEAFTPEEVQIMKEQDALPLEIHTNDTIERYNEDSPDAMLRLYYDDEEDMYNRRIIRQPTKSGVKMSVYQNADIQMLWGVTGDLDFSKKFCSVVIECEVSGREEKWWSTHRVVCAYMDEHQKRPSKCDKNPDVKKLASWVSTQRMNYDKNAYIMGSNPSIRAEWTATLEKYGAYLIPDADEQWRATHRLVCDYMDEQLKPPSQHDKNHAIKKLGTWISNQKINYEKNVHIMGSNPDIRAEWGATMEKYGAYLITDFDEQWRFTHRLVCAYMDEHQKPPSKGDKNPDVKKLGSWISKQKTSYVRNTHIMRSNHAIRHEWEATVEKYGEYLADADEQWRSTHRLVCAYMDEHQKPPSSSDKNPAIKKLGSWITTQKTNYAKNACIMGSNPEILAEWGATMKKYGAYLITDFDEQWRSTHRLVCAYMDEHQKPPSSADKNPAFKKLGRWICNQKSNYAKNACIMGSNPAIRAEWATTMEKYKEYLADFDEPWRSNHRLVCAYMDEHQKAPSQHNKNPDVKKLGEWIATQKKKYAKIVGVIGSNPEIRDEWEATLAKYGKFLKQTIRPAPALLPVTEVTPISEPLVASERKRKSPSSEPTMEPEQPGQKLKLVPKKRKAYADLTEAERQRMCENVLRKRHEEKGYQSTNPDDKDTINSIFAGHILPTGPGKVIFLDHTEFKTAFALLKAGIKPEDMLIPQRADNFTAMARHEVFGSSVTLGEFNDVLRDYLISGGLVKGVYADYCSTLEQDGLPFLALLELCKPQFTPTAVVGVTITLRNPEGVRYAGQDIAIMEKRLYRQFPTGVNLFHQVGILASDDGPYTYGNGAPMATWLLHL